MAGHSTMVAGTIIRFPFVIESLVLSFTDTEAIPTLYPTNPSKDKESFVCGFQFTRGTVFFARTLG